MTEDRKYGNLFKKGSRDKADNYQCEFNVSGREVNRINLQLERLGLINIIEHVIVRERSCFIDLIEFYRGKKMR